MSSVKKLMKVLVCGVGRITDELLKRVSEDWEITVIEKDKKKLEFLTDRFPNPLRTMHGDASSPVVLEQAGLAKQDYVLALTNDDRVNYAIAAFAKDKNIHNIMAVVRDPEILPKFKDLDVWTTLTATTLARKIYNHLKDPHLNVIDLGQGEGEILELELDDMTANRLKSVTGLYGDDWRPIGILRKGDLIFPTVNTRLLKGDRLLILGKSGLFETFADHLVQDKPRFPLSYGQELILAVLSEGPSDKSELLNEALYLARNAHITNIRVMYKKEDRVIAGRLEQWAESLQIHIEPCNGSIRETLAEVEGAGIAVIPPISPTFLESLTKPVMMSLAHELHCPLLISRHTAPYKNILLPFNGNNAAEAALEAAIDLAMQCGARLSVLVVEEPDFLHGNHNRSPNQWRDDMLARVRSVAHIRKIRIHEQIRSGNPVKEILSTADSYDLLVIASATGRKELLEPNVGETIVREAPCSALVVTK